jgi:hypothetical protein
MIGLSHSIRIGVPTATDSEGRYGQGLWWVTGHARPGLLPEKPRRVPRRKRVKQPQPAP